MTNYTKIIYFFLVISFIILLTPNNGLSTYSNTLKYNNNFKNEIEYGIKSSNNTIIGFSRNILLSSLDTPYPHHVEPTLAISDTNTLFVGWKNAYEHNSGGVRVSYRFSTDNGRIWSFIGDMPMFNGVQTHQSDPWIVWSDNNFYYAYLEFSVDDEIITPFSQITVAKTDDSGTTWNSPVAGTYGDGFADKETMAIGPDGTIYVVYDDIADIDTVRLSRSTNGGNSFQETSILSSDDSFESLSPYITLSNSESIFVAWLKFAPEASFGDIYLDRSDNNGNTFTSEWDINQEGDYCSFTEARGKPAKVSIPVIRFDQFDRLYALWSDVSEPQRTWDVFLRYSDDYGSNWSPRIQINPKTIGNQWMPDMDIDKDGIIHIAYLDEQNSSYKPYYRNIRFHEYNRTEYSLSNTLAVAEENTSSKFTRPGDYLTVRVNSNNIPHVVWTDGRNNEMDIYYSHGIINSTIKTSITTPTDTDTTSKSNTTSSSISTTLSSINTISTSDPSNLQSSSQSTKSIDTSSVSQSQNPIRGFGILFVIGCLVVLIINRKIKSY
jgi:hypothetical protein